MQIHDIDDYYRTKRFPWLLVALVAIVAGGAIVYFTRGDKPEKASAEATEETVENAGAVAESGGDTAETVAASVAEAPAPDSGTTQPATITTASGPKLSSAEIDALLKEAKALEDEDKLELAREKYLYLLESPSAANLARQLEANIGRLSIALVTTPRPFKGKVEYVIKSGDALAAIAVRHNCHMELIQVGNAISNPSRIKPGNRLMILKSPKFELVVSKSANTLTVLLDGRFFKKYTVGTGVHSKTPAGTFVIYDRTKEPAWWPGDGRTVPFGDPENILGTRWLALRATGDTARVQGYGIHGTWDNASLGKQSSAGCIRMNNKDVEELYMLLQLQTPVRIVE